MSTFDPLTASDRPVVGSSIQHEDLIGPHRVWKVAHVYRKDFDDPCTFGCGAVLTPQAAGHGLWVIWANPILKNEGY